MVYLADILTEAILSAPDERTVCAVVNTGVAEIHLRRKTKSAPKKSCYLNLIMALKYRDADGLPDRQRLNINKAIEILENLRSSEYESIF